MSLTELSLAGNNLDGETTSYSVGTVSVADPWHFGVDPDPDPKPRIHASGWLMDPDADPDRGIFIIDLQYVNKN